ncbi:MAG TPA: DUF2207 domain-containing protein [Candidatus Diapherotrites archaeon]|uniref:DUF2207 domain-containing protein n=1 Tax=Candidatus Iainarchaeum sp. TaxID=3101447 RepID=A0A7J4JK62_9ARCH|nr:hypothetical protein [Candidatus Diapherotrites archaeon]HIH16979.1 DUF2207 domain-containing protein [Candidatus Diapherotrites archaeon]
MPEPKTEASIIDVIRQMVAAGESEEKILQTLKDLGVEPAKAQRLLLLGQADTFTLLRGEINKIVTEYVEKEKPRMVGFIEEEAVKAGEKARREVTKAAKEDLDRYEKDITGQSKTFQEQINETVASMAELNTRVREKLNELGEQLRQAQLDLEEMKLRGVGGRNRIISLGLVLVGLAFFAYDFYLFSTQFGAVLTIDSMIVAIVVGLIGITCLFVATLV